MFTGSINSHAQSALTYYHNELTTLLVDRDVISYIGDINFFSPTVLKEVIEFNKTDKTKLAVLIYSGGGSVESAEKMVQIMRFHYEDVVFIIPEMAMSAATNQSSPFISTIRTLYSLWKVKLEIAFMSIYPSRFR